MREGLEELRRRRAPLITDVRGRGLMLAFELRSSDSANRVIQEAFRRGLLLIPTGVRAIRVCPALTISGEEVMVGLELLDEACAASIA